MTWAALGLAVTAVGLAVRMYFLGRELEQTESEWRKELKRANLFADKFQEMKQRMEARVHELKEKNEKLFQELMHSGGDGARRGFLNRLLQDEDSESTGNDSELSKGGSANETGTDL